MTSGSAELSLGIKFRGSSAVERSPVKRLVVGSIPTPGAMFCTNFSGTCRQGRERSPVKRLVVGSIPTPGAKYDEKARKCLFVFLCLGFQRFERGHQLMSAIFYSRRCSRRKDVVVH